MGRPGLSRFLDTLKCNHVLNCPITVEDANHAEMILGRDITFLKGKMMASPAKDHLADFHAVALPPELLSLHPKVTLCFDVFYVLGLAFSLSISCNIHFMSCWAMGNQAKETMKACIVADLTLYSTQGFHPMEIHANGKYNIMKDCFPNVHF